jgi:hypothetical protein
LIIHIEYGSKGDISQELLGEIRDLARKHGELAERRWGRRAGAIDLVTVLEVIGVFAGMKILDGLVEGLVGKDIFVEIGKKLRKGVLESADLYRLFLLDFFKNIVSRNKNRYGAFVLVEHINDFTLYVVLNNMRMSEKLIEKLPEAIALSVIAAANIDIEDHPRVLQLYPNFETDTWDYLLMPSTQAFGKYIDRYFDLKQRSLEYLKSPDDFIVKFCPDDKDDFKFLVSPNRDYDMSKFNEL